MKKLMVKVNDCYIPEFQIVTSICKADDGTRFVTKRALTQVAQKHIEEMKQAEELMTGMFPEMEVLPCRLEGDTAVFPFVDGKTLLEQILETPCSDKTALKALWQEYFQCVLPSEEKSCLFLTSEKFEKVFGSGEPWEGQRAFSCCAIDMLPSNIFLCENGKKVLFDYEWLMDVPVPISLVLFNAISICYDSRPELLKGLPIEQLFALAGIEKLEVYQSAKECFYQYIYKGNKTSNSVPEVYGRYLKPTEDIFAYASENQRLIEQLRNVEDGWNQEHAHALQIDRELQVIRASRSWRATKPLRAFGNLARKLIKR